jgi:sporulation protein YlmC with PRC-barrel domain
MRVIRILSLLALCAAGSVGCAHSSRAPEPVASVAQEPARFGDKWLSAVIGMTVVTSSGTTLGRVQDVIVDGYGRQDFAIVRYGGMAGVGARYTAVPWATVAEMLDRDRLVIDRMALEGAPQLENAGARNGTWRRDAERYWQTRYVP